MACETNCKCRPISRIIATASQAQHGKDTLADYLALKLNATATPAWKRVSFASQVKRIYTDAFGVDNSFIEQWKTKTEAPPGFDKNVRQALQFIGDGFRQIQGNIWLELCFRNNEAPMIISDSRYVNELRKVNEMGGLNILILRAEKLNDDPNGSEAQIRPILDYFNKCNEEGPVKYLWESAPAGAEYIDFFIRNDGSVAEYYEKIDNLLIPHLNLIFN